MRGWEDDGIVPTFVVTSESLELLECLVKQFRLISPQVYKSNYHHHLRVVSVHQDMRGLEGLEQWRDNLPALLLVKVDDLGANLCDIYKSGVRGGEGAEA